MSLRELRHAQGIAGAKTLCVMLGSFDPLHRGHEWIAMHLLKRFEAVLLLVPARHFEKRVVYRENATFRQRLCMLEAFERRTIPGRIAVGLAEEVLFVRLRETLAAAFPTAGVLTFGMGDETFQKLLASRRYFERLGLTWGPREQQALETLRREAVVFNRGRQLPGAVSLPSQLQGISSSRVRRLACDLHAAGAPWSRWRSVLEPLVDEDILRFIRDSRLYVPSDRERPRRLRTARSSRSEGGHLERRDGAPCIVRVMA